MKINSKNLILMALVGMSSVHLMAAPTAPAAKPTGNKSTTTKVYEAGKAAVGTAASAVYNAPGYLAARASGATHSAAVAKPTKFITGNTGSLRSATAAIGDRLVNLTLPEGYSQKTTLNNNGRVVEISKPGSENLLKRELTGSQQSLSGAAQRAYHAPGLLAIKLGLSKDGEIISTATGKVVDAATAAKTTITETLSSIGATMTPSLGQQAAIHAIYRNALKSISSTPLWTAEKFNAFTRSVSEQVQRVFETKAAKEARILKEQNTWAPNGVDGAYYG